MGEEAYTAVLTPGLIEMCSSSFLSIVEFSFNFPVINNYANVRCAWTQLPVGHDRVVGMEMMDFLIERTTRSSRCQSTAGQHLNVEMASKIRWFELGYENGTVDGQKMIQVES